MVVYVITWSIQYEDGGTHSVYLNKDSADAACETLNKDSADAYYCVEEYTVNE